MKLVTPEYNLNISDENQDMLMFAKCSFFLAGTIDNGDYPNWQHDLVMWLTKYRLPNVTIYNPRREHWNKDASDEEQRKQIEWEQNYLDECDYIIMLLGENSKSPISLMELGQYSQSGKIIIFCNDKFYRYQNVKYLCDKENITMHNDISIDNIGRYIIYILGVQELIQSFEQ